MRIRRPARGRLALFGSGAFLLVVLALAPAAAASSRIAFVRSGDIWTIAADGTDAKRLTGNGIDYGPVWSPDRRTIAFIRSDSLRDIRKVCTVSSTGGPSHRFNFRDPLGRTEYRYTTGLAYSPDGRTLAISDGYGPVGAVFTHNCVILAKLASGESRLLIKRKSGLDTTWRLSWSPDGRTMLLGEIGQSAEGARGWRLNVGTGKLKSLGIPEAMDADWSPDGKWIVVSTMTQETSSIALATAAGKVVATLAEGVGDFTQGEGLVFGHACFSPDGSRIAYDVTDVSSYKSSVWIMDRDGGSKHRLTAGTRPAWD